MKKQFPFDIPCDEAKIQDTIAVSKAAFLAGESEQMVSHAEFLYHQSKFIKKRWWFLQGLLLAFVCLFLCHMETDYLIRRALGLAGPLFVILILPELWKNRNFDAMEVECTTYYTIRSIYAARLTLFAGVDLLLLSAFFAVAVSLLCCRFRVRQNYSMGNADPVRATLQCDLLHLLSDTVRKAHPV